MTRKELLQKAEKCVNGDRDLKYGKPENNFKLIAAYWGVHLGVYLTPEDVAVMLALMKIARLKSSEFESEDSWVDLAGYAACGAEIATKLDTSKLPHRLEA